ncbi:hypothetical protein DBR32_06470 [Taibaiella sp. KBW10]|nr:Bax inhibitor-1/YccA family protein [Taibaiella sp. KBW10]RQO31842.1 hypothetical protein DBR32_06470 [Taibaiella sp. KBW10]
MDGDFVAKYITKVYGWMFLALCITASVSFFTAQSGMVMKLLATNPLIFFGLFIGQLFLVGYLSLRVQKMSSTTATLVFLLYAALTGITLSTIFFRYTNASILSAFSVTAVTFGIMTAVGYFTKKDLTSFGRLMLMGLIGVIVASVINIFLGSPVLYWIISYVGVAVFVGLIAYDTQKIKQYAYLENAEDRKKGAIIGALALYLDFINLFLMLLRIFGRKD